MPSVGCERRLAPLAVSRFDTMPSSPIAQACQHQLAPGISVLVERDPALHAGQQPCQAILGLAAGWRCCEPKQRPVFDPVEFQQVGLQDGVAQLTGGVSRPRQ